MTDKQKKYIENNIEFVENGEWEEFFKSAPEGVGSVLYEVGIDFMSELGYIPYGAFYQSEVQTVVIPDSVTSIGSWAFGYCPGLTSIIIPDSVTSIDHAAFTGCSNLTRVTIGTKLRIIDDDAFSGCSNLTSITIPEGVTSIGELTFYRCTGLANITIPNSVTSIREGAFCDCGKIKINYNGTVAEWKNLIGYNDRVFMHSTYTCSCIDGVVKKSR